MGAAKVALLSKDRGDANFSADNDPAAQHLLVEISATHNLVAHLAKDHDSTDYQSHTSTATVTPDAWSYLVYSLKMIDGADTEFEFFIDDTSDGATTLTDLFLMDLETYPLYLFATRKNVGTM
ncbi:MAG: hypothetical protein V2I33_16170, partial [Kangiellaceae bacterium]|nr:hypothetical protein [Kangiellaceae bacterium]